MFFKTTAFADWKTINSRRENDIRSLDVFNFFYSFLLFQVSGFKFCSSLSGWAKSKPFAPFDFAQGDKSFAKFEVCLPFTINNYLGISTVSIIERHTGKILWYKRIKDLEPRPSIIISDIQIGDNNLYVLDTGSTLHIFEKE